MRLKLFSESFTISPRKLVAVILLVSSTLAWFFLFNFYISDIFQSLVPNDTSFIRIGQFLFYIFTVFWAIAGSLIGAKVDRRKLLLLWIFWGIIATASISFFHGPVFCIIFSSLLGFSLGFGLPSSMALIGDWTNVQERARVSGIIILAAFLMAFLIIIAVRVLGFTLFGIPLIAFVKSISLLALILDRCEKKKERDEGRMRGKVYKDFLLYLFPWVTVIIAGGIAINLIPSNLSNGGAIELGEPLRLAFIAIFGFAAGFFADRFGRRQPLIIGLFMLGASIFLIGLVMNATIAVIFYAINGVAWGLFFVVFLSIPSDLSNIISREKYYAIGTILPLVVLGGISTVPIKDLLSNFNAAAVALILGLILFVSIIPIMSAKETLPESQIRDRKMSGYVKKIEKIVKESKETGGQET